MCVCVCVTKFKWFVSFFSVCMVLFLIKSILNAEF